MSAGCFELNCRITVEEVPDVRRFVEKVHRRIVKNQDDVSRVAMATHELFENAVKFSADGSASLRIEVVDNQISITTRNLARESDLAGLSKLANELHATPDPMMFYLGRMSAAPNKRGGLGIGRVAAEGEMQIELALEGNVVEVRATSQLQG